MVKSKSIPPPSTRGRGVKGITLTLTWVKVTALYSRKSPNTALENVRPVFTAFRLKLFTAVNTYFIEYPSIPAGYVLLNRIV